MAPEPWQPDAHSTLSDAPPDGHPALPSRVSPVAAQTSGAVTAIVVSPTVVYPGPPTVPTVGFVSADGTPLSAVTPAAPPEAVIVSGSTTATVSVDLTGVFRFLPPLSISDDLLHEAFDVVAEAFAATAG